jgi:4-hydroxy-tetrahydrodipicolinate reductase
VTPAGVVVCGALGRMGRRILALCHADPELRLAGATVRPGSPQAGSQVHGVTLREDLPAAATGADVIIDFTTPVHAIGAARLAADAGVALVVGTTGLGADAHAALEAAAQRVPVVWAPNMSVGVNLLAALVDRASRALGAGWDAEIVELHHRHKRDAPSGTALALAEAAARARGLDPHAARRSVRDGDVGARPDGEIGVMALRGGDVVGEHTVFFLGGGERLELTHRATDRDVFARGALRAARWAVGRPPGLYGMREVLGLE